MKGKLLQSQNPTDLKFSFLFKIGFSTWKSQNCLQISLSQFFNNPTDQIKILNRFNDPEVYISNKLNLSMNIRKMLHQMSVYKNRFENIENLRVPDEVPSKKIDFNFENEEDFSFEPMGSTSKVLEASYQNKNSSASSSNSIGNTQGSKQIFHNQENPTSFRQTIKKKRSNPSKSGINQTFSNLQQLGIQRKTISQRMHQSKDGSSKSKKKSLEHRFFQTKPQLPEIKLYKRASKRKSPRKSLTKKYGGRVHKTIDVGTMKRNRAISPKKPRKNSITPWQLEIQQIDTFQ